MQDIRDTLFNMTKSVAKTSGDLLKTTKLNMNLSSEESNLKSLYFEIGKKVHEIYQYGGSLGNFFDEKYLEIEACERKIAELKEQISVIKGVKICSKCGKSVDRTAEFCQKCGIRVELSATPVPAQVELPTQAEPLSVEEPAPILQESIPQEIIQHELEPELRKCRVCSSLNESGTKFCLSCGRILD